MDRRAVRALLEDVRAGRTPVEGAVGRLAAVLPPLPGTSPSDEVARVDHHRALRCGVPEVVLGSAKQPADLVRIALEILTRSPRLLVTRVDAERADALVRAIPDACHHGRARAVTVSREAEPATRTGIAIVAAGTGDVPVAEEARVTAAHLGQRAETLYDVGVAGVHRVLSEAERLRRARVVVVVAGMEGALASVTGGLVSVPVIAVPTSVGVGLHLDGVVPLLGMLNACAPNVCVVNVDNGFGAGYLASLINGTGTDA
jgi:NCAIR mutase (PurE)-related protein